VKVAALPQLALLFKKRGGKRPGAGRPAKGPRSSERHKQRPFHRARFPVHVTLRAVDDVGNLRRPCVYRAIREATLTTVLRENFRIVHLSVQHNHLHLIVEADDKKALSRGMQGFQISAAKHINAAIRTKQADGKRRKGRVFVDRYHIAVITSPTQARHAISYVLCNWRKHEEDRKPNMAGAIDWYSTGVLFPGWKEYGDAPWMWKPPKQYDPLVVYVPRTWLLREGWKKAGTISYRDVPSKNA
jgi:REP element-mobilizing transposase RayT